jgi:hypothetical protein
MYRHAAQVKHLLVWPADLAAILYDGLGIPHDTLLSDYAGQPHRITEGRPITPLLR